jgi:predicted nucleotidyltransferase
VWAGIASKKGAQRMEANNRELLMIIERLKGLNLHKVILFGSFASGQPREDSDIDLLVVTNDEFLPQSHSEKSKLYLSVSNALTDLAGKIPIDLIVHTKAMYQRFIQLGSLFSKEILQKGVVLYEADH